MEKLELAKKLNVDERSVYNIVKNEELCKEIMTKDVISLNDYLNNKNLNRSRIRSAVKMGMLRSFSNSPITMKGARIFVFKDEIEKFNDLVSVDNRDIFRHLDNIVSMIAEFSDISSRERDLFLDYFVRRNNTLQSFSNERNISSERVRQIILRIKRKILANKYRLKEICELQYEKEKLVNEITFLKKNKNKHLVKNDIQVNTNINPILLQNIFGEDLSVRLLNALKSTDIKTVGDVLQYSKKDLKDIRNMGAKSINELLEFLSDRDLRLKD